MRIALTVAALSVVISAHFSTQSKPSEAQIAIEKLRTEMKAPLAEISALDESDRKLAISNQVQIDTTAMSKRAERHVLDEDMPALQARWDAYRRGVKQYIDSGCPAD